MTLEQLTVGLEGARPRLAENLVLYAATGSTNDVGRRIVQSLPSDVQLPDTLIVALEQSAGRGRDGRVWSSPSGGGLYASLIWPLAAGAPIAALPPAVAVGLCDAMRSAGVPGCGVKWPNDLVVGGRKLGGVLVEVIGPTVGRRYAVIGFGINLAMEHERLDALAATSLERETGDPPDLVDLAIGGSRGICRELRELRDGGDRTRLVDRFRSLIVHRPGDRLLWRQGQEVVEGSFRRIDATGCLELETESGSRVVNAGEIVVDEPSG